MFLFFKENISTIVVMMIITLWFILAVRFIYKNRKNGCSANCATCATGCSKMINTRRAIEERKKMKSV